MKRIAWMWFLYIGLFCCAAAFVVSLWGVRTDPDVASMLWLAATINLLVGILKERKA